MKACFATGRPAASTLDATSQLETLAPYPSAHRAMPGSGAEGCAAGHCAILAKRAPDPYPGQDATGGSPTGAPPQYTEAAHPGKRSMSTSVEELAAKAQELSPKIGLAQSNDEGPSLS